MSKLSKWLNSNDKSVPIEHTHDTFWEPFYNFQKDFNRMFNRFYRNLPETTSFTGLNLFPACDIIEDEKEFKVEFEMPGVDEKDIKVSINSGILIVNASKETSRKDEGKNYLTREIGYGAFERQIPLPENADVENAHSSFKKGMLWVVIPKKESDKSKVRELEVKKASE